MDSRSSRFVSVISTALVAALLMQVDIARSTAAESSACEALEGGLRDTKPDTDLQLNIALFSAVDKGCLSIVQRMLAAGASVEASNRFGTTALGQAARSGNLGMVDFLLAHGAAVNARNVAGATPLYIAAESGRTEVVARLLEKGADPNLTGRSDISPLAAAAYKGNEKIVADLLAHHANPNAVDRTEKTPILYAAAQGFAPVVQRLLDAGVDPKAQYGNDLSALMWAAGYADGTSADGAASVAKLLLDHGAVIDAVDNRGRTPLMIAAETGHLDMVDLLIGRGANRNLRDKSGKSAADIATSERVRSRLVSQ